MEEDKPRSREELLNSRPITNATNALQSRATRERISQMKQGNFREKISAARRLSKIAISKNVRISASSGFWMILVALLIDSVEMIATWGVVGIILGWITPIFADLVFWFWFKLLDVPVGFGSPKKLMVAALATLFELIPGLDALGPLGAGWTAGVIAIILITRAEDKTGIKILKSPPKASRADTIES